MESDFNAGKHADIVTISCQESNVLSRLRLSTFEKISLKCSFSVGDIATSPNRFPSSRRVLICSSCSHIATTSWKLRNRFRLRSSSVILGQVSNISEPDFRLGRTGSICQLCNSNGSRGCHIDKPSRRTTRSSCKLASCLRILSKPTSSASFPLIRIAFSAGGCPIWKEILICSEAYLNRNASKNDRSLSAGRLGRINDAAFGSLLTPSHGQHVDSDSWTDDSSIHLKYLLPPASPLCFPRVGSSHSTPSQSPFVPSTSPTYLIVHSSPLYETRRPTLII